jgi:hypothetical protein
MLVLGNQTITPDSENLDFCTFQSHSSLLFMYLILSPLLLKIILLQLIFPFWMVRLMSPAQTSHPGTIT